MHHRTLSFIAYDGLELFAQYWLPEYPPRAVLALVHGIGEHSGRYSNLLQALLPAAYAVWGFDQRGHGRSPGQRGHVSNWAEYRADVACFLDTIVAQHPDTPIFLFGYSMGALVVLDYAMRPPAPLPADLHGLMVVGTPLTPVIDSKRSLEALARWLSQIWPRLSIPIGIHAEAASHDAAVIEGLKADPLVHGRATVRWATGFLDTVAWVNAHPEALKLPTLMLHGAQDPVCRADGVQAWFNRLPLPDKMLRIYPDSRHEVHNDVEHAQMEEDVLAWLAEHLPASNGRD